MSLPRSNLRAVSLAALVVAAAASPFAQAPRVAGWSLPPGVETQWFSEPADLDGDGDEELIMSTIDGSAINALTPPTPTYVLAPVDGNVVDRTSQFFAAPPLTWGTRTILTGDFNGDGQLDLYFCTLGREVVDRSTRTTPRTPGVWGEQDLLYFGDHGRMTDRTALLPQVADYSHGCASGDIYKTGRQAIVINDLDGPFPPYRSSSVIEWDGAQFAIKHPFPVFTGTRFNKAYGFYTAVGDFDRNGHADVIGDQDVLWGSASGPASRPLPPNALETATFGAMQGRAVADFNGDGYQDAVKILSTTPAAGLSGARFVLYTGGPGGITEKLDAFPAPAAYKENDFGLNVSVLDLNFDGFLDMATLGFAYNVTNPRPATPSPNALWLNDGTGRFTLARFSDRLLDASVCGGVRGGLFDAFFLKTSDPRAYNLIVGGCYPGAAKTVYTARRVTPESPITFLK